MEIPERNREPLDIPEGSRKDDFEEKVNPFHEAGNHDDGDRGGLEGAVRSNSSVSSLNLDIPSVFDRCLEDDCEICFEVEKSFDFDNVYGESKQDESSVILKAVDQEKVGSELLKEHNPYKFEGKVIQESLEGTIRDEMTSCDTSKYVDFLGVDAFVLKIAKNFVDRVNLMAFGLNSFWAARLYTVHNLKCSRRIKYSKYLYLWSGKVQFQGQSSIDSLCKWRLCLDSFQQKVGIKGRILHNPVELTQENKHKYSRAVRYSKSFKLLMEYIQHTSLFGKEEFSFKFLMESSLITV
ncbi:hypothetical protein PRUPE_8G086900 [Prunus persica]|uniref:Uncharacterized protein n=1 Tax=Prunus persica TaxID=3760 RepID=A0A251MV62_PRUPE|nr:hypothetical protein PRUPE_8G086900 [Prunus persica]